MSWSVTASGRPSEVRGMLSEQWKGPLADKPAGLSDDGERETVRLLSEAIEQCVSTFGEGRRVYVSAAGHMGFSDWDTKEGAYQEVHLDITPLR